MAVAVVASSVEHIVAVVSSLAVQMAVVASSLVEHMTAVVGMKDIVVVVDYYY